MVRLGRQRIFRTRPQLVVLLVVMLCLSSALAVNGSTWRVGAEPATASLLTARHLPPHIKHASALLSASTATPAAPVDCHAVSCLALTFDDGPNPVTTPLVLAELEQAHITATFFLIGSRVNGNEAILQRMHADGDEIGNHSWSHPDLTKLPIDQVRRQIDLTQQAIFNAGVPAPTVFRPPYGTVTPQIEHNIPLSILLWNEDPRDWAASNAQQVIQSVEASAKPGGIIDMHDIYHVTANALPQILTDLTARGLHFVTVDQLLDLTPSSRGIYYGHQ